MRFFAIMLALAISSHVSAQADIYEGEWSGTLDAGVRLRLVLDVSDTSAVLISVDQSGVRMPVEIHRRDDSGFTGTVVNVGAEIDLNLEGENQLSGTFSQSGATLPLTLQRGNAFEDGDDDASDFIVNSNGVRLAGTLQAAEQPHPVPAILMLNGSGSQDRDVTIGNHSVFAVLADALMERGITTLRLDDRGIGGSDAVAPNSPYDLAQDVRAALDQLRRANGVNPHCIGLLGHSEGGMIAFLAAEDAQPDFILSLAGIHTSMAQTLLDQSEAIVLASGAGQAAADQNRAVQNAVFAVMRDETVEDYPAALAQALTELGLPAQVAQQQGAIWGQGYAIAALDLDIAPQMTAYAGPVHGIFGENDLQALAEPQSAALMAARGDQPTEVTVIPGVNHLFQTSETGLPQEYANAPHAMASEALTVIADAAEALIAQACE